MTSLQSSMIGVLFNNFIAAVVVILIGLVTIFKYQYKFFQRRNIPSLTPTFPFGNAKKTIFKSITFGEQFKEFYDELKQKNMAHGGVFFFARPFWVPTDIQLIKNILQTDFAHFMDHGNYFDESYDPLSGHLFNLEGTKWRNMRVKLTPTFTSGKMKLMFSTLADCTVGLNTIMSESAKTKEPVDIKDILARFTTDIIGSVAFGIECNSLKDPNAEFRKYGKRVFTVNFLESMKLFLSLFLPFWVLRLIKFQQFPQEVNDFFLKAVKDVVEYREKNNIYRKDFMHLLLQLKNKGKLTDDENISRESNESSDSDVTLTMNELSAQAFVFFLAGFETSSTTMTFALLEIATNPDVQTKLRDEINAVLAKHEGKMTYDAIMEMQYMDRVLYETLRKYPPVPILTRKCTKEYKIPNSDAILPKDIQVGISALGIHYDPEYYPNPEKFDPDRFTEENKSKRPPCSWLPFGEGPRLCIGLRFGLMQSKVGLATLLKNYQVSLNEKTHQPIIFEKDSFITSVEGGVWLDVKQI